MAVLTVTKDNFEAEFFDNFDIYQTEGFYREGKYNI